MIAARQHVQHLHCKRLECGAAELHVLVFTLLLAETDCVKLTSAQLSCMHAMTTWRKRHALQLLYNAISERAVST